MTHFRRLRHRWLAKTSCVPPRQRPVAPSGTVWIRATRPLISRRRRARSREGASDDGEYPRRRGESAARRAGTTSMRLNESATCVCSQASYTEDQLAGKWRPPTALTGGETERGTRLRASESSEGASPMAHAAPRRALLPGLLIQVKRILAFLDAPRRARAPTYRELPFMVRYLKASQQAAAGVAEDLIALPVFSGQTRRLFLFYSRECMSHVHR